MINGKFAPYLFSVILVISILPISILGQQENSSNNDFVELLEMQLVDVKQENLRLVTELDKIAKENQSKSGYIKDIENLNAANSLLKAEIIKLDIKIEDLTKNKNDSSTELAELRTELKKAKSETKDVGDSDKSEELQARCTNLEDENSILKSEVDKQKQLALKLEAERNRIKGDFDQLFELQSKDSTKSPVTSSEIKRLQETLSATEAKLKEVESKSIDKGRAAELSAKIEEMKAVETQRKEALDDLFKQLAGVKADLKTKESEIMSLEAKVNDGSGVLQTKEMEIATLKSEIKEKQSVIDSHSAMQQALQDSLDNEKSIVAAKSEEVRREVASRQSIEAELSRLKLTDGQRKKTMDDVLTSLANAENLNTERSAKIISLESKLSQVTSQSKSEINLLNSKTKTLEEEISRMEQELKVAIDSRDTLKSKITEGSSIAERDTARIVELESELARVSATDTQRKKRMDKLLLEIAELEDTHASNLSEVEKSRMEVENSRANITGMKNALTEAQNDLTEALADIKKLKSRKPLAVKSGSKDVSDELALLQDENDQLQKKIQMLEMSALDNTKSAPQKDSSDKDLEKLLELEKVQWVQARADLESEIALLQKDKKEQLETLSRLKGDLAEAQQAREQLSKEVNKLQNRKIDVRSSDLFQEIEEINVTLREKIVQIESERQRLEKSEKKLLKREEGFDKEISHEENLRQKAETEIADARAREVEYQELIERLMSQVPQLEAQISELTEKSKETSERLRDREEDLLAIKTELEKREHRLIKAEQVANVLETAREEVLHANDKEKLDMHYNMAAVYARDSKYEAAEQEYLQALRLNPTDADVHYNLGILYEDEFKSPAKAIVHYRRYLKLNPHGPDADQVRNWLMKLEMKQKR